MDTLRNRLQHAATQRRVLEIHDLLQHPFFVREMHQFMQGEPVTERFANFILEIVHAEPAERRLLIASGLHPRLGAESPLQNIDSDIMLRIINLL